MSHYPYIRCDDIILRVDLIESYRSTYAASTVVTVHMRSGHEVEVPGPLAAFEHNLHRAIRGENDPPPQTAGTTSVSRRRPG